MELTIAAMGLEGLKRRRGAVTDSTVLLAGGEEWMRKCD